MSSSPKSFGAIRNDNNIYISDKPSVWDESFEHTFGLADGIIPELVDWLKLASSAITPSEAPLAERLTPLLVSDERFVSLSTVLASLIVRSPCFRDHVDSGTRALRTSVGLLEGQGDRGLLGLNIRRGQDVLSKAMTRGKFVVLLSGSREFIFGDGFLHNIHSVTNAPMAPRCLVPLTPEIAIFYTAPLSYRVDPRAFTMNLTSDEINFVNRSVQIYSKRFIFYRSQKPVIEEEFRRGEHRQWQDDRVGWTDALETTISETFFGNEAGF